MRLTLTFLLAFLLFPAVGQKVLDFTEHDFSRGKARLNGQWEFYWDQLLSPSELSSGAHAGELVSVPSSWIGDGKHPGLGKGTYRVMVRLPKENQTDLSFYFPPVRCAVKVWVNGILKDSIVVVGDRENYHSRLSGLLLSVPDTYVVELVV